MFPIIYHANKRTWVTKVLMNGWFENYFIPKAWKNSVGLRRPDVKIVLIVDNSLAHMPLKILAKDKVTVLFFPPNCTSIIQP
ncbi:MAG: hypothetical protein E7Y34_02440, partial [Mycoplasma sp.]|nr:hypothetical protein [Mycoplasma sp.]